MNFEVPLAAYLVSSVVRCPAVPALKAAGDILKTVLEDGQKELDRASAGLALSASRPG